MICCIRETASVAYDLPGSRQRLLVAEPFTFRRKDSYVRISFTPFLPATVLRTPLRVRALVRVR